MALYEIQGECLAPVEETSFAAKGILERKHLQRLLRQAIEVVAPGTMVIAEEFGNWEDSNRRIDLLCMDEDANLVVVELKRSEDGGHMELQALRYAAMVSAMTFARAVEAHAKYLKVGVEEARARLLAFLAWDSPEEEKFAADVRIVLVAADFSRELTTSVMWLNQRDLDITCVRLRPHCLDGKILLDVGTTIPLPEAGDFLVRMKEKAAEIREGAKEKEPWSGYWFVNVGEHEHRCWEDARQFGYVAADGEAFYTDQVRQLKPGDKLFAYLSGHGYVGYGEVLAEAVPHRDFIVVGTGKKLTELPLQRRPKAESLSDEALLEYCVAVRWQTALDRGEAFKEKSRRNVACKLHGSYLVGRLCGRFGVPQSTTAASDSPPLLS